MKLTIFTNILNMSLTASIVILIICLIRILLKRTPKIFSYVLWSVVLFRLLCPFSIEAPISAIPNSVNSGEIIDEFNESYIGNTEIYSNDTNEFSVAVQQGVEPVINYNKSDNTYDVYVVTASDGVSEPLTIYNAWLPILSNVWLIGIIVLIAYSVITFIRLRIKLRGAVPLNSMDDNNIYLADYINSPFVMGIFNAKIYLPATLSSREQSYIILHEQHHVRRRDHIVKMLAFIALCIHWFNPLVWLAFILASKDMEMSCDEAVLNQMGEEICAEYSASLLSLAIGKRIIAGTPLAFGEGDTKARIKNALSWKKPTIWTVIGATIICIGIGIFCFCNPIDNRIDTPHDWTSSLKAEDVELCYGVILKAETYRIQIAENEELFADMIYILNELPYSSMNKVKNNIVDYEASVYIICEQQEYQLKYQNGITEFVLNNNQSWQTKDEQLANFMRKLISLSNTSNVEEAFRPTYEAVAILREKVLAGMAETEIERLKELVQVENQDMEYSYLYENNFSKYFNSLNELKSKVLQWKDMLKTDLLDEDFSALILNIDTADKTQDEQYLYNIYYILHDLDYFLLRYGPVDVGMYTLDDSTVSKYYGVLKIYAEPYIVKTYNEAHTEDGFLRETYYEMSDGTWRTDTHTYLYRLALTGRTGVRDTTYYVLSNTKDISFQQAMMASGLSSHLNDYFDPEDAVIVEWN